MLGAWLGTWPGQRFQRWLGSDWGPAQCCPACVAPKPEGAFVAQGIAQLKGPEPPYEVGLRGMRFGAPGLE